LINNAAPDLLKNFIYLSIHLLAIHCDTPEKTQHPF